MARLLWIVLAVLVWNVVFDHVIVSAGRDYIRAANDADIHGRRYVRAVDLMAPAARRALGTATAAGGTILVAGLLLVRFAAARRAGAYAPGSRP